MKRRAERGRTTEEEEEEEEEETMESWRMEGSMAREEGLRPWRERKQHKRAG
jgi:hypothetical protein